MPKGGGKRCVQCMGAHQGIGTSVQTPPALSQVAISWAPKPFLSSFMPRLKKSCKKVEEKKVQKLGGFWRNILEKEKKRVFEMLQTHLPPDFYLADRRVKARKGVYGPIRSYTRLYAPICGVKIRWISVEKEKREKEEKYIERLLLQQMRPHSFLSSPGVQTVCFLGTVWTSQHLHHVFWPCAVLGHCLLTMSNAVHMSLIFSIQTNKTKMCVSLVQRNHTSLS